MSLKLMITWHVTWHVTDDVWHVADDVRHVTYDVWHVTNVVLHAVVGTRLGPKISHRDSNHSLVSSIQSLTIAIRIISNFKLSLKLHASGIHMFGLGLA